MIRKTIRVEFNNKPQRLEHLIGTLITADKLLFSIITEKVSDKWIQTYFVIENDWPDLMFPRIPKDVYNPLARISETDWQVIKD